MRIEEILQEVLELRKAKFEDIGVTIVRQPCPQDVTVGARDACLGQAIGQVIDNIVRTLSNQPDRRVIVRSRGANRGIVVEIDCAAESVPGIGPTARLDHAWLEGRQARLAQCRQTLSEFGGRLFVGSVSEGTARFVIEVPPEADAGD